MRQTSDKCAFLFGELILSFFFRTFFDQFPNLGLYKASHGTQSRRSADMCKTFILELLHPLAAAILLLMFDAAGIAAMNFDITLPTTLSPESWSCNPQTGFLHFYFSLSSFGNLCLHTHCCLFELLHNNPT